MGLLLPRAGVRLVDLGVNVAGGLDGVDEGDVFDYSHTKLLTKFDLCLYHVFPKQDQKQFAYLGPGVGVLAQPPGDVVEGDVEAAGVVALPAEHSSRRR